MTQLVPCPACLRHVRKTETACPFCGDAVSLAHVPAPVLPSSRLGRAATFAFGATLVGATAIVSCSSDDSPGTAVYGGPPVPSAGAGGEDTDTPTNGGSAVYGAPPSELGGAGGVPSGGGEGGRSDGGAPPDSGDGGYAGDFAIYGGPPAGAGGQIP